MYPINILNIILEYSGEYSLKDLFPNIHYLDNNETIDWIIGENKWNKPKRSDENKKIEKKWENSFHNKELKQWSTRLGEGVVEEILTIQGNNVRKPEKKNGYKPDWETDDAIYEVKTRSWTTSGTAGEKILGVPYKYASIPRLYNKPLYIVLVAYQEYEAVNSFNLFNNACPERQKIIDLWKEMNIFYIKCSDLLNQEI
jgi:hypothetical protein